MLPVPSQHNRYGRLGIALGVTEAPSMPSWGQTPVVHLLVSSNLHPADGCCLNPQGVVSSSANLSDDEVIGSIESKIVNHPVIS